MTAGFSSLEPNRTDHRYGLLVINSAYCPVMPRRVTHRASSPSGTARQPNEASHSRIAFSSMASNTGLRSPADTLRTCSTSEVSLCRSRALFNSLIKSKTVSRLRRVVGGATPRWVLVVLRPFAWLALRASALFALPPVERRAIISSRRSERHLIESNDCFGSGEFATVEGRRLVVQCRRWVTGLNRSRGRALGPSGLGWGGKQARPV